MDITIEDMKKAYSDLAKLAFMAMVENHVDLTLDEYTGPNTKAFLIAAHREGDFHARKIKEKSNVQPG